MIHLIVILAAFIGTPLVILLLNIIDEAAARSNRPKN